MKGGARCSSPRCRNKAREGRSKCHSCTSREVRDRDPIKASWQALRFNARRRGKAFEISLAFWRSWVFESGYFTRDGARRLHMTVDRINPDLGYLENNIQALSRGENSRKRWVDFWARQRGGYPEEASSEEELDPIPF